MNNETNETRRLTPEDSVDPETLKALEELANRRLQVADRVLDLEQEKVAALMAARDLDRQRTKIFEKVLIDRGISPTTPVEIDGKTGKIIPVMSPGQEQPAAVPQK